MKSFTDGKGRRWRVRITLDVLQAVHDETGVDLVLAVDPASEAAAALSGDLALFDVLVAVLDEQLVRRGVTADDFRDSITSQTIADDAIVALANGIREFFPDVDQQPSHEDDDDDDQELRPAAYTLADVSRDCQKMAGILGVRAGDHPARELKNMLDGCREDQWWHTANVLAMLVNVNRGKGRPVKPAQFHPCIARAKPRGTVSIKELARAMGRAVQTVGKEGTPGPAPGLPQIGKVVFTPMQG